MAAVGSPDPPVVEAEWVRVFDARHSRHYYFNARTGASQWVRPKGVPIADAPADMQERADRALGITSVEKTTGPNLANSVLAKDDGASPPSQAANGRSGQLRAKKLRSFAKGVANMLGLRKRNKAEKAASAMEATGPAEPSTDSKEVELGDAVATDSAAASTAVAADPPPPPASASAAAAAATTTDSAEADASGTDTFDEFDGKGGSRLQRTASDMHELKPPTLVRTRSILKRSSTMHEKRADRRISFADQAGGDLEVVRYCENLHYSAAASTEAAADPSHMDEDGNCSVM
jgi:hypothetical protein